MTPPAPSSAAPLAANVMKPCWPQRCPTPPRRPRRAGPGVRRLPARNADRGEGHRYHDPRGRSSPLHRWRVAVLLAPVLAGFAVIALTYGALGLLLGVLVKGDLEGFFLIITGGLTDTFLQNPARQPAGEQARAGMVPVFRPDAVRSRRLPRAHRAMEPPRPRPGLDAGLRPDRARRPPPAHPHPATRQLSPLVAARARTARILASPVPSARSTASSANVAGAAHPAAQAALRASPPRPVTSRIAIEPSMRCIPGPTWPTAIACIWLSRRNRATRA